MISVEEAITKVKSHLYSAQPILISVRDGLDFVLAEDIFSKIDMPPFPQSAMDGYAVNLYEGSAYTLKGEVKAGDSQSFDLKKGEGIRIFTGAAVPETANAVIMQEKTKVEGAVLSIEEIPKNQQNIRPQGEQIRKGELVISKGTVLSPSALSFLVSLGVSNIKVYSKPQIAIVVTGSELVEVGQPLTHGKIYESNSILLANTLKKEGFSNYEIYRVADDFESTKSLLDELTLKNDFVLVSGGISVGDYDFVGKSLKEINTQEIFYKIKQKPGKPLFFGKRKECYVFALPGNPASALTCFYMYALPMLRYFSGNETPFLSRVTKKISHNYTVKGIRAQFLKAVVSGHDVSILSQQSSAMIAGFMEANAYVFVPEFSTEIKEGERCEVILLS